MAFLITNEVLYPPQADLTFYEDAILHLIFSKYTRKILSNNKKKQYNNLQPFIHTRSIRICPLSPDLIHPITTQNEEVKR